MSPGWNAERCSVFRGTAKRRTIGLPGRRVSRRQVVLGDGYPYGTVIENAEEYRLTLEALADVEVQLEAVDETLCNLPEALRDVMRRALADNRDALLKEIADFEQLAGMPLGDVVSGRSAPSVGSSM